MERKSTLYSVYLRLLSCYGKQEWWPASGNFTPREWEICIGAVLTQNTNWKNVEKALENMKKEGLLSPEDIVKTGKNKLEKIIKPSGFFSQKAERLKELAKFVISCGGFENFRKNVARENLLKVKGIGPETADSILLYACSRPEFVIDAYTKRIFSRMGISENSWNYEKLKELFESSLPENISLYREYHALIVEHGKNTCRKRPLCSSCPLEKICKKTVT